MVPYLVTYTEAKMNATGQLLHTDSSVEHIYCLDHLLQLVAIIAYDANVTTETDDHNNDEHTATADETVTASQLENQKAVNKGLLKSVHYLVSFLNKSTQAHAQLWEIQEE